jgi:nucleotide sugar dehydrogenase
MKKHVGKFKIGVVGNGYVGKASQLFACEDIDCVVYDIDPDKCKPLGTTPKDLKRCDFVFVCVPTPMKSNGSCDLSIVKSAIKDLTKAGVRKNKIVLRSTVPVGTSEKLKVNFMPEFLTEQNWQSDFYNNNLWVFGMDNINDVTQTGAVMNFNKNLNLFRSLLEKAKASNKIKEDAVTFTSTKNAEAIKYGRNSFLATKVSFFNEIQEFCINNNLNYEVVRKLICADIRIGDSHSKVPGPDKKRGFGGTCFPKDVASMLHQMKKSKVQTMVLKNVQNRNEKVDRPEKDWQADKGRAVSE